MAVSAPVRSPSSAWLLVKRQGQKIKTNHKKPLRAPTASWQNGVEFQSKETNDQFPDLLRPKHQKSTARSTAKRVLDTLRPTVTKARIITKHCSVVKFELRLKSDPNCPERIAHIGSAVQFMDFLIFRKISPPKKSEKFQYPQVNQNHPWFCLIPEGRGDGDVMGSNLASNLHIPRSRSHYLHTGAL